MFNQRVPQIVHQTSKHWPATSDSILPNRHGAVGCGLPNSHDEPKFFFRLSAEHRLAGKDDTEGIG